MMRFGVDRLDIKRVMVAGTNDIQVGMSCLLNATKGAGKDYRLQAAVLKECALFLVATAWELDQPGAPTTFEAVEDIRAALATRVPLYGADRS